MSYEGTDINGTDINKFDFLSAAPKEKLFEESYFKVDDKISY